MQRYFIDDLINLNDSFTIEGNDFHHIKNVMRSKIKEQIIVCNSGSCFLSEIISFENNKVTCQSLNQLSSTNKDFQITIAQSLIRRERFEYMLQKATELGVDAIIPITTMNTIIKVNDSKLKTKIDRWNTICKEASEQSHRSSLATVSNVLSLKSLQFDKYDIVLVAYEKEIESSSLKQLLQKKYKNILVVIGPEGGFDPKEIEFLSKIENTYFVGLGPRILRSETASSYILSAISYEYEMII